MIRPAILAPCAKRELAEAVHFLETQAPGLGHELAQEVLKKAETISLMPELHAVVRRGLRRAKVNRFPYLLIYRITPRTIDIVAVFHTSRNPAFWQSR